MGTRSTDDSVSERIATLERTVREQAHLLNALGKRVVESDANVQRLVAAVERLIDQAKGTKPKPTPPAPPIEFESGFRPRIVKEGETPKRHRIPLAKI